MQPTDHKLVGFRVCGDMKAAKENERESRELPQGLVGLQMKAKLSRVLLTVSTVAMIALAGGASLRGF